MCDTAVTDKLHILSIVRDYNIVCNKLIMIMIECDLLLFIDLLFIVN